MVYVKKIVSVIHMFDLMPGASRQSEPTSIQHKINLTEISVCRAGSQEDQYIVFIDEHRDLFCATVKRIQNQEEEIYKIGTQIVETDDHSDFFLPIRYTSAILHVG